MADEKYISKIRLPDGDTYALKDTTGHTHALSIATSTGTNQLALAANKRYVITAGGSSFIFTTPQDKDTTYTAGSGLDLSGTEFKHSNSVTAQNTQGLYPITIDSTGHIASYGSRVTNIVNTITTTAGQHSAISSQHGNVSFKVPTHLSHLQNDTGFITSSDLDYYLKLTGGTVTGNTSFTSSVSITDLNAGQLVVSGSASVANNLQVSTINGHALSTAKDNNSIAVRTANGYLFASYFNQSSGAETPTTSSYIMYANSDGYLRKSTLANIKSILGLGSNAYTSTAYLPLAGGTMTGDLLFSDSGTNTRQIRGVAGANDYWRIAGGATASNAGWMEIATADDGTEPIYVRQYTGAYTTIKHTLTLLDADGNTTLPGRLYLTNSISYKGAQATYDMIKFKDSGDTYGHGIIIGGGGFTVIGSGESADSVAAQYTGGTETTVVAADGNVEIATGVQDGYTHANTKKFDFNTSGDLHIPRYGYATYLNQSSGTETPTDSSNWMFTNSDGFLRKSTRQNLESHIYPYEAKLQWGGQNHAGTSGPLDASLVPELGANRFAFAKAEGITVEYSRDTGSTWTNYGLTDAEKTALFSSGVWVFIGKADSTNKATANGTKYQLRVTLSTNPAGIYTELRKFAIYVSTSGSNSCTVTIQRALESTPTTFVDVATDVPLSGWSGWNIINITPFTTYGNTTTTQNGRVRFIFKANGGNTNYPGLQVCKIQAYGGFGWTTPSYMAANGHLYTYDSSQNATFPAQITATQFNGKATQVRDSSNGNAITITYGKAGQSSTSWLASWNGYELGAISPAKITGVGTTHNFIVPRVAKTANTVPGKNLGLVEEFTAGDSYGLPSNHFYYILSAQGNDTAYSVQLALGETINAVYYRRYASSSWGSWTSLVNTNTTYSAGTGLSLSSTTFSLATSGATAGSYGPSANATPSHGGTFSVPYVTVDTYGRVTSISTKTITLPADSNTDTKIKLTSKTDNVNYKLALGPGTISSGTAYEGFYYTDLYYNPSTKILTLGPSTTTNNIYMGLATSDALYTAINNLGWVSSVIV